MSPADWHVAIICCQDHNKIIDPSQPRAVSPQFPAGHIGAPTVHDAAGTSLHVPQERRLFVTMCGDAVAGQASYVLRVEERVQVSIGIDMDYSEFFAEAIPFAELVDTPLEDQVSLYQRTLGLDRMVNNFANLLGIPQENVKVACVHPPGEPCCSLEHMILNLCNSLTRKRHRRSTNDGVGTEVELEINPPNALNETGNEVLYQVRVLLAWA